MQLVVNPKKDPARTFLQNPYLILTTRLTRNGEEDQEEQMGSKDSVLTGTRVSSLYNLKDLENNQGGFFVFGDLFAGRVGTYRLTFTLHELRLADKECRMLSHIVSDRFVVYTTKTFCGLTASTPLTRHFKDQGVRLVLYTGPRTVSTKRPTISQADLPYNGGHDLSPTGHALRHSSLYHDPAAQLGRPRSYRSESSQIHVAKYTVSSHAQAPYDDAQNPPYKRACLDVPSLDSPSLAIDFGQFSASTAPEEFSTGILDSTRCPPNGLENDAFP